MRKQIKANSKAMPETKQRKHSNDSNPDNASANRSDYTGFRLVAIGVNNQYTYVPVKATKQEIEEAKNRAIGRVKR